jgi:diadenosine tetraphosphatase ApaH/serine/threonine PP2A family protein phosphatase
MIRRRDRKAHCISTGADRLDPARICPWLASLYLLCLRNGVRSGKYAIERGDDPPSMVKDRTEDHRVHLFVHSARDQAMRSVERVVDQRGARYAMPTASTTCCALKTRRPLLSLAG